MKKFALVFAFCCLWAVGLWPSVALPFPFSQPFSHYADNEPICAVLADFARTEGYGSVCSPALTGEVSGRFDQVPPRDFLAGMGSAFGVRWYTQGRTVTFWHENENSRSFLAPTIVPASSLLSMFQAAGMVSPQLPVKLLGGQNMLSVTGPPLYVEQLRHAMAAFEEAQGGRIVMRVFPLRHAWAEDMNVNSMDAVVTIPGVASILRAMISGDTTGGSRVSAIPAAQERLLGQGLASTGQQEAPTEVPPSSGQPGPTIIADPRVNAVVITDAEYRLNYYARVIAELDRPVELVEIHAAIVDIDSSFSRELGINWSGSFGDGDNVSGGGSGGGSSVAGLWPVAGGASAGGLSFSTLYSHGADYFLARINALEEDGQARMLGKPSVLTMDNIQASLENTSTYYIPVEGKDASDLFKVESGTVLKVTPHIIPAAQQGEPDSIKLMVSVQDDREDGSSSFSVDTSRLSPIKQTRINTQAIVREGQSLLIGGYYYETQSDSDSGIPGLKNVPILGGLFGSTGKKHQRMERLILITPRIVRLDQTPQIPPRVDDPRFSRTAVQADYEERVPTATPTGGCARRAAVSVPVASVQPAPPVTISPVPASPSVVPASNRTGGTL